LTRYPQQKFIPVYPSTENLSTEIALDNLEVRAFDISPGIIELRGIVQ
jgi:hypothetical protein